VRLLLLLLFPLVAQATTAFLIDERDTGMTRQCVYEALGSEYTITISITRLCPLTIEV